MRTIQLFSQGNTLRIHSISLLLAGVLTYAAIATAHATPIYLDNNTVKPANAWPGSYSDFPSALAAAITAAASAPAGTFTEIWIAKGTYTAGCNINLPNNVNIIGGFNGNESSSAARSFTGNLPTNATTLVEPTGNNCYLFSLNNQTTNTLNGLALMATGGVWQNGGALNVISSTFTRDPVADSAYAVMGGGIFSTNNATLTIDKSLFSNGYASLGAAIGAVNAGSLAVTNSTFNANHAYGSGTPQRGGAAIAIIGNYNNSFYGAPQSTMMQISNSTFTNNWVDYGDGGAISIDNANTISISGATFGALDTNGIPTGGNKTGSYNNGGAIAAGLINSLVVSNSKFYGNSAAVGGAIYTTSFNQNGSIAINNSTFNQNSATTGGAIADQFEAPPGASKTVTLGINSNIFYGNTASSASQGTAIFYDLTELTIDTKNSNATTTNIDRNLILNNTGLRTVDIAP